MTKANWIECLLKALESKEHFLYNICPQVFLKDEKHSYANCAICRGFLGLTFARRRCLCNALGTKEAVKRTWLALEEGGYLEQTSL